MHVRVTLLLLGLATAGVTAAGPDALATARRLYNLGQYDRALEAAREAAATPATAASARLVIGRINLERYRESAQSADLEEAHTVLLALDPQALDGRERVELQVGLAELLYFDDQFGAAAELFDPVLEASSALGPNAHERVLDWWANALDRQAQASTDRTSVYERIVVRMEQELRRDPASFPASYWLAAASRGAGDLDRAWAAASAGWIRGVTARDRGVTLRADLDRLVTQAIIPDRAARGPARDRRQVTATMIADWESFKKTWSGNTGSSNPSRTSLPSSSHRFQRRP
jgi:tetratricopeptide (TPR) repeat protein